MTALLFFLMLVVPFYLQLWLISAKHETEPTNSSIPISVVIPFRNEIGNLGVLKNCIDNLELIQGDEIILVDDHSSDNGAKLLTKLREEFTLVAIPQGKLGSKKEALKLGIGLAKNTWILCTDADCTFSREWVKAWRTEITDQRDFIAGQVALISSANSVLGQLISMEHIALQTITKASIHRNTPLMCSGANLMFRKSIWLDTGAYGNNISVASGDDVLFMKDVAMKGGNIAFADNSDSLVATHSALTINSWFQQRLRWMSKSSHIDALNSKIHAVLLLIWLIVFPLGLLYFGWLYLLIIIPECLVLRVASPIKPQTSNYLFWPFFRIIYPFIVLTLFIASFFVKLSWKGRAIKSEA